MQNNYYISLLRPLCALGPFFSEVFCSHRLISHLVLHIFASLETKFSSLLQAYDSLTDETLSSHGAHQPSVSPFHMTKGLLLISFIFSNPCRKLKRNPLHCTNTECALWSLTGFPYWYNPPFMVNLQLKNCIFRTYLQEINDGNWHTLIIQNIKHRSWGFTFLILPNYRKFSILT